LEGWMNAIRCDSISTPRRVPRPNPRVHTTTRVMANVFIGVAAASAAFIGRGKAMKRTTDERDSQSALTLERSETMRIDAECELALAHADHEETRESLEKAEDACRTLAARVGELETAMEGVSRTAKEEKEKSVKLRFSLTVANSRSEKLRKEIEGYKAKLSEEGKVVEENNRLKERARDANKNLETTRENVKTLTEKNGALTKRMGELEHELEDARASEQKLETARKKNVALMEELESVRGELAAVTHSLQDAEVNLRQAESGNVQTSLECEELREEVVQLRAHEREMQEELKQMLETLTLVTSQQEGGADVSGFASPAELEKVMSRITTPLAERIQEGSGDDIRDVQARMTMLLTRVEECKTPVGISKALEELDELQGKLRDMQSVEGDFSGSPPRDVASPDPWPISPPSPVNSRRNISTDEALAGEITPPRNLSYGEMPSDPSTPLRGGVDNMCEKCGIVARAEGLARCADCHAKKQAKLAASPLQRGLASFKKVISPKKDDTGAQDGSKSTKKKKKGKKNRG
jgi:hypothetical protein